MTVMVTSHREAVAQVRPMAGMTGTAGKGTATGTTGAMSGTSTPGGTIQDAKHYAAKALPAPSRIIWRRRSRSRRAWARASS